MRKIAERRNEVAMEAFRAAKGRFKGNDLAKVLGITPQAVSLWKMIPAERVVEIEAATGIPREDLRPDLYRPS